jgi:hypothetical protein
MSQYGPQIPGLDINKINQFNSDFGKNNVQLELTKKRQVDLKRQVELQKQINIQRQINEQRHINEQRKIDENTERSREGDGGMNRESMEDMERNIGFDKKRQQDEYMKRAGEYGNKEELICGEFPEDSYNIPYLVDKNDEIKLKESTILNSLMEKERHREKVSVVENIEEERIELNEFELEKFKGLVKKWLSYDDEIRIFQKAIKDRRQSKADLTPTVMDFMKTHDIEDLNTRNGKLRCYVSNRKKPLTQKDIKHKLLGYFKSENKGEKCVDYVFGDREIKEVMNLRRTFKKK